MSANISASSVPRSLTNTAGRSLKVGGVTPFTATDYPGKLAAVVFVQGCPLRCGYCHNPHLQLRTSDGPLQWSRVLELLKRRVGLIDAVVFSGGEPTIDPALGDAILDVSELGFSVGLHTAGVYPERFASVLPLLDWVGLDIKAPFAHYEKITGLAGTGEQARACAEMLVAAGIDYECRTTVHPALLPESALLEIAQALTSIGVQNYVLQAFRAQGCKDTLLNASALGAYPSTSLVNRIGAMFQRFTLRWRTAGARRGP